METANHEYYVSLEVAKLLKEAGFDWECKTWTQWHLPVIEDGDSPGLIERGTDPKYTMPISETYPRPTLAVAQKWLREVKGWDVFVRELERHKKQKEDGAWEYPYFCELHDKHGKYDTFAGYTDGFYKYEEAQEEGIQHCLYLILDDEKKEN